MKLRMGTITQVENNSTKMQTVQISGPYGETSSGVENFTNYGFTSYPMPITASNGQGAECILSDVFGAGYTTILATTDRRYRPTTGYPGDAILYASHDTPSASHSSATQRISLTDEGGGTYKIYLKCNASTILMKSDNTITVSNGSGSVVINADGSVNVVAGGSGFNITGQLNVSGVATFNSNVTVSGTLTT